jgi:hypothetical protein
MRLRQQMAQKERAVLETSHFTLGQSAPEVPREPVRMQTLWMKLPSGVEKTGTLSSFQEKEGSAAP